MKITFILPPISMKPIGGYKVVYQYANALVVKGYQVSVVHLADDDVTRKSFIEHVKYDLWKMNRLIRKRRFQSVNWFHLNEKIISVSRQPNNDLLASDIMIATGIQTVKYVNECFQAGKISRRVHFIQGQDDWIHVSGMNLQLAYKLGFEQVCISHELAKTVQRIGGNPVTVIPNFVDSSQFSPKLDYLSRPLQVALLNHVSPKKNTRFGIEVLSMVKEKIPDLHVLMFGATPVPSSLPKYYDYTENATPEQVNQIFSQSRVYILPSLSEGWGLTGLEAMSSGSLLIASDINGIREYANEDNSILISPNNKTKFVDKIVYYLLHPHEAETISQYGVHTAEEYTLQKSIRLWEDFILGK